MVDDNITSLTTNFLLVGLLLFGMVTFFILIVNNEGRGEIFDGYNEIDNLNLRLQNEYGNTSTLLDTANINLNLSGDYNPELTDSGADRSGNAISINAMSVIRSTFAILSVLGGIVFGNVWFTLSVIFGAILVYVGADYIIKKIRTGS